MDLPCPEWRDLVLRKWERLSSAQKRAFTSSSEPSDIFSFCFSVLNHEDAEFLIGLSQSRPVHKDPTAARSYREQGNASFKERHYTQAALLYSQGLCQAAPGSEERALCYANRSAALLHLKHYQECLKDISRALSCGYPKNLHPKLLGRRAECLSRLEGGGGEASSGEASAPCPSDTTGGLTHKVTTESQGLQEEQGLVLLPSACPAVALQFDPSRGRHLMAVSRIAAGEAVLEEEAFACVLIPGTGAKVRLEKPNQKAGTEDWHCHRCLSKVVAPVPCQGCCYARYCGEECQGQAWEGYHKTECPLGGALLTLGVLAQLALRVALVAGLEEVLGAQEQMSGRAAGLRTAVVGSASKLGCSGGAAEEAGELKGTDPLGNVGEGSQGVGASKGNGDSLQEKELSEIDKTLAAETGPPARADPQQGGLDPGRGVAAPLVLPGCDSAGRYLGSSYLSVHHLLPHSQRHSPALRFLCGVTIAMLCQRLQEEGPLPDTWGGAKSFSQPVEKGAVGESSALSQEQQNSSQSDEDRGENSGSVGQSEKEECREPSPELSMLGTAALRHMLQLRCNAQAVTAVRDSGRGQSTVESSAQVRIATAIFPTLSLLNHSCSPNTSATFRANTVTVRASQPIGAGQELLHCYGPHRSRMPVCERRRLLEEQYFFLCQCAACCEEQGSEGKGQLAELLGVRCTRCGSPVESIQGSQEQYCCSQGSCGLALSRLELSRKLLGIQEEIQKAVELIERDRPDRAVKGLRACQGRVKGFLSQTHPVQGEIADSLARAYAVMGQWEQAAAQLSCSVDVVRSQYGDDSVELGHQLFKLAQLHFNGHSVPQALSVIPEAQRILTLHCGPAFELVQELQEMELCLRGVL
ncbi:SET and MYND domain-containing protein 4 [Polyodon spathula]|uniref:SET and MYND domain-containing protein 4 n=1 Tax=Polyodon spathula TaxID=7913 RepID=UPI001B7F6B38|nr:SET and MYND domain-containing protein 4 [Polyodon spathula]